MTKLAIIVEFETLPGKEAEFLANIREHARATLAEEPGCLRFEVIKPVERDGTPIPNKVMVNELYADEANPRLPKVGEKNKPLLASRRLILAQLLPAL
jgi:quinol monooxygenase YgiN